MFKSQLVLFLLLSGGENSSCLPQGGFCSGSAFPREHDLVCQVQLHRHNQVVTLPVDFDSVGNMKFREVERDLLGMKEVIWAGQESIKGFICVLS